MRDQTVVVEYLVVQPGLRGLSVVKRPATYAVGAHASADVLIDHPGQVDPRPGH